MKCNESLGIMLDILYGEEVEPTSAYRFFCHLKECCECDAEFKELVETREILGSWDGVDETPGPETFREGFFQTRRFNWWGLVQKAAATLLIIIGGAAAAQEVGLIPERTASLPEAELARMINDIVVERQAEGWMVIGEALVTLKEDLDAKDRRQTEVFYRDLDEIEERFLAVMEQTRLGSEEMTSQ